MEDEVAFLKSRVEELESEIEALRAMLPPSPLRRVSSTVEAERGITSNVLVTHAVPTGNVPMAARGRSSGRKKIIYLVRHAEAAHNVVEARLREEAKAAGFDEKGQKDAAKAALPDENFRDALLSSNGKEQVRRCEEKFEQMLKQTHYPMPTVVLVSPLRRTLMTTSIMFPRHSDIRAKEFIRERRTGFPCDERQAAAVTKPDFPDVDFSDVDMLDECCDDGFVFRDGLKEGYSDVARRGDLLLPLIERLEADVVAVVSHKGFIRELLQDSWKDVLTCAEDLRTELSNAEVRVCEATWAGAGAAPSICMRSLKTVTAEPTVEMHEVRAPTQSDFRRSMSPASPSLPLRMGVASSGRADPREAVDEAWRSLRDRLGCLPTVALVCGHCSVDAQAVAERLREVQPSLSVVGCSSMRGVIASDGRARLGIMGFDGLATRCGVGHVCGSAITDAFSAQEAGVMAAKQATQGCMPDLIIMFGSAGFEEYVLSGISKVCMGVRVFGSTSGNDMLVDGPHDTPWQIYGSMAGWGAVDDGGLVLLAVWKTAGCRMHNILNHCYGATKHSGTVTRAEGRDIFEIDDRAAGDVLLEWTGISLPGRPTDFAQYALAFNDRLVDFKGVGGQGELQCFASTAWELGRSSVQLVSIKPSGVTGAIREVVRKAREDTGFDICGALVVICAGTSCLFTEEDFQQIEASLKEVAPEILTLFSYGEQGNTKSGMNAFHGNNMLNFLFFS